MDKHLQRLQKTYQDRPDGIGLFFKITPDTTLISIEKLSPIRAREEGIQRAIKFLYEASQGRHPKREPLTVTQSEEQPKLYDIIDGNSTWHVAKKIGMQELPIRLVSSQLKQT